MSRLLGMMSTSPRKRGEASSHSSVKLDDKLHEQSSSPQGVSNSNPSSSTKEEHHDRGGTCNGDHSVAPAMEKSEEGSQEKEMEGQTDDASEVNSQDFTTKSLRWYNPVRRFCGRIVNDETFQLIIVLLIVVNAALMGVATYDFVELNPRMNRLFVRLDKVFLVIFTIECVLQIGYHGYRVLMDGWLIFDLVVVVISWALESMQVFRAVRIFRAFRLLARLTILKDLVNAIVKVLPRIGSIMLLFALVIYIYSVLCTILYGDFISEDNTDYFGSLELSVFTLFQFVTLDNWGGIAREIKVLYPSFNYVVLSFLTVSSFILYSLVVAVVCDAVAVVEHPDIALRNFQEQMKQEKNKTQKRVSKLTAHLDGLSQQQMKVLCSVQRSLMRYPSFREDAKESQLHAAESHAASQPMYKFQRRKPLSSSRLKT